MMARSWSGKSHPTRLPDKAALVPDTNSVQSPLLSSIQRPAAFFFTMCETLGGGKFVGMSGLIAGLKLVPRFGGGFLPPYGLLVSLTTLGPITNGIGPSVVNGTNNPY